MTRSYLSPTLKRQIIEEANYRCGYCLSEEVLMGVSLVVDHITPLAAGGSSKRSNLWSACRQCNELKNDLTTAEDPETSEFVPLFNPREQKWSEHFAWNEDFSLILGLTPTGRATIGALQLNRTILVRARQRWRLMGWHPAQQ